MDNDKKNELGNTLGNVANTLRGKFEKNDEKRIILLFAYNAVGKTRLSMEFKEQGKQNNESADTLYFNAFTEDLFIWDNDLENDSERKLTLNIKSRFFAGFIAYDRVPMIRDFLACYADFNFEFDTEKGEVRFSRKINNEHLENIKISRGEENIFIWCWFLVLIQFILDEDKTYSWVQYIYIDDPISSLDDNNAVSVAHNLAKILKAMKTNVKTIISSHHPLFFNVLCNELKKLTVKKYFFSKNKEGGYELEDTGNTPSFYHVAMIQEIYNAINTNTLYTYHFNILRVIMEKTASFHGYSNFSDCIKDEDEQLKARIINILSHGNYSLYEPVEMGQDNKELFKTIFNKLMEDFNFNKELLTK